MSALVCSVVISPHRLTLVATRIHNEVVRGRMGGIASEAEAQEETLGESGKWEEERYA